MKVERCFYIIICKISMDTKSTFGMVMRWGKALDSLLEDEQVILSSNLHQSIKGFCQTHLADVYFCRGVYLVIHSMRTYTTPWARVIFFNHSILSDLFNASSKYSNFTIKKYFQNTYSENANSLLYTNCLRVASNNRNNFIILYILI